MMPLNDYLSVLIHKVREINDHLKVLLEYYCLFTFEMFLWNGLDLMELGAYQTVKWESLLMSLSNNYII